MFISMRRGQRGAIFHFTCLSTWQWGAIFQFIRPLVLRKIISAIQRYDSISLLTSLRIHDKASFNGLIFLWIKKLMKKFINEIIKKIK